MPWEGEVDDDGPREGDVEGDVEAERDAVRDGKVGQCKPFHSQETCVH